MLARQPTSTDLDKSTIIIQSNLYSSIFYFLCPMYFILGLNIPMVRANMICFDFGTYICFLKYTLAIFFVF